MNLDDPLRETGRKSTGDDGGNQATKSKTIVRLVAVGFFVVGGMNLFAYFLKSHHDNTDINMLRCVWLAVPVFIGVWVLVKTTALADWLDDWLEQ